MKLLRAVLVLAVCAVSADLANAQGAETKMARNTPRLQLFQGDGSNFVLVDPLIYEIKKTGEVILVPSGFVTDFASVPWYARSIISVLGRHSIPAIVHDYLYWEQRCTRDEADAILADAMAEYGSSSFQRWTVYNAVKYRAGGAWTENKTDRSKGYIRVLTADYKNIPLNTEWNAYREHLHKLNVTEPAPEPGTPTYCKIPKP